MQQIRNYNEQLANDLVTARDALVQSGAVRETNGNSSSSMSGSIKSVTEKTADLLASYINAIRATSELNYKSLYQIAVDVRELQPITQAQLQQLQSLVQSNNLIEANTRRNAQLVEHIDNILKRVTQGAEKIYVQ